MEYIDINCKLIRKDPKYYLKDILSIENFDGSGEMLYNHLININYECEIHLINTGCVTPLLIESFTKASHDSSKINVIVDD